MKRGPQSTRVPHYPSEVGKYPLVAILGRPNVGKSTLFNRLTGRRASIVQDEPGVTRDRIYADTNIDDKKITVVDTGGWEYAPENQTESGINKQCHIAIEEAHAVLFVVDGSSEPTPGDFETAAFLRKRNLPTVVVVNKIDGQHRENDAAGMYALGMDNMVMVSSEHGRNFDILEDRIYELLPEQPKEALDDLKPDDGDYATKVAVIGRPNAGKSTLINALLQEERLLTMDKPGTTRDAIDIHIKRQDQEYVFIDTAGMRRKAKVSKSSPEYLAVSTAVGSLQRCHVAVLLLDATREVSEQDAKVLGLAVDRGRAIVIAINKWDTLKGNKDGQKEYKEMLKQKIAFAPWAKTITISALKGEGLNKLLREVDAAEIEFCKRVKTSKLNELFDDIVNYHPPPVRKGRPVKMYFATQADTRPPTFVVQASYPEALHFSYKRYIENRIREEFGFDGTPIRMVFKKRKRK